MHDEVANSNPTNYIFLRSAINTLSIEHIKSLYFQNLKVGLECLLSVCKNNRKIMEEYGIMEHLELAVTRCGRWTGNRKFIWSGLIADLELNLHLSHPSLFHKKDCALHSNGWLIYYKTE